MTEEELLFKKYWVNAVISNTIKENTSTWLDNWLSTATPFSFEYDDQEFKDLAAGWQPQRGNQQITWADCRTGLRVDWKIKNFLDYPAVEWVIWFENCGTTNTPLIENIQALNLLLKHSQNGQTFTVHGAKGGRSEPDDYLPFSWQDTVFFKEIQLGDDYPSSNNHLPFFNIETPEEHGILVGVGWSGRWLAKLKVKDFQLRALAGLKETRFVLYPGEKVRSPRILLVFWKGIRLHGHNMLRQILYKHYVPHLDDELQKPLVSINAGFPHRHLKDRSLKRGLLEEANENRVLPLIALSKDLGVEVFTIDAGWYKTKKGETWHEGCGNWTYDNKKYPCGFRRISGQLAAAKMSFGLWFGCELVNKGAPLMREHPEWLTITADRSWGILRMEISEAREWFLQQVQSLITNQGINSYRQDMDGFKNHDSDNRKGLSEIMHVMGLYSLWDTLRGRNPRIIMENCCSGGRRIDLETVSRFHWHQKSDRIYDSESDQCGAYGANLYLPGGLIMIPIEKTDDYNVWSSYAGLLWLGWYPLEEDFPIVKANHHIALYKRIRHLLSGDFYPLTPCSLEQIWIGYQFHRVDLDEGFALLFKRFTSKTAVYPCNSTYKITLRGLHPERLYNVHFERTNLDQKLTGNSISKGLEIIIDETPGVEMVIYKPSKKHRLSVS